MLPYFQLLCNCASLPQLLQDESVVSHGKEPITIIRGRYLQSKSLSCHPTNNVEAMNGKRHRNDPLRIRCKEGSCWWTTSLSHSLDDVNGWVICMSASSTQWAPVCFSSDRWRHVISHCLINTSTHWTHVSFSSERLISQMMFTSSQTVFSLYISTNSSRNRLVAISPAPASIHHVNSVKTLQTSANAPSSE